jgi:hypothetical protein
VAYRANSTPQMIENFDATQFILTASNGELLVTIKNKDTSDFKSGEDEPLTIVK